MPKARGREHTTLTETAAGVVRILKTIPGVKMIAPGEIRTGTTRATRKYLTIVHTTAGFELIVSGQSTQKIAVHTATNPYTVANQLIAHKKLRDFIVKERERKPGV